MRKIITVVVSFMMLTMLTYGASNKTFFAIDDKLVVFEEGDILVRNGKSYVPLRESVESLGGTLVWFPETNKSYIRIKNREVEIDHNEETYIMKLSHEWVLNNGGYHHEVEMIKHNNRTYISVSELSKFSGYSLSYMPSGPIVRLSSGQQVLTAEALYAENEEYIKEMTREVIYLTYDDGPNQYTEEILDLLAEKNMKATFFMMDGAMKAYPDTVKRMVDEGHSVALHSVTHDKNRFYGSTYAPLNEMNQTNNTLYSITGQKTKLIRTPYGSVPHLTNDQHQALVDSGYKMWDWHIDSMDWANRDGQTTYDYVVKEIQRLRGKEPVVLFHDSAYTVETTRLLLEWMEKENITSKGLEESMDEQNFKSRSMRY